MQSYEAVSDPFVENAEVYLKGVGKPVERKPIVDQKYYVYARNLGERPTSMKNQSRNKGRFDHKLERFQRIDALSVQHIYTSRFFPILGSDRRRMADHYIYGREYIDIWSTSKNGWRYPKVKLLVSIMVSDPTVQIDTDLIVKEGVGVGLKE